MGERLADRYWIESVVARGELLARLRAADLASGRDVCIEVRAPPADGLICGRSLSTTAVRHPNIAEVFERGVTPNGIEFVVLEPLEGELLSARIAASGCLKPSEVVEIAVSLALGLGALHACGLVHGALSASSALLVPSAGGGHHVKLVELLETRSGDARVDIAALGSVVHEMLGGSPAPSAAARASLWTIARRAQQHSGAQHVPELERVASQAVAGGFASMAELSSALWWGLAQAKSSGRIGSTPPAGVPRIGRSLGVGLLLGVIALSSGIALMRAVSREDPTRHDRGVTPSTQEP